MNKIFISYRRDDTNHLAGRLYDGLGKRFGNGRIFKDVDSIPPGVDYRAHLEKAIGESQVVLVLIGKRWLSVTDTLGARRLDGARDLVRMEIEFALSKKLVLIPILADNAPMPKEEELPVSIRTMALRNAMQLRPDPDFHRDINRLVENLDRLFPSTRKPFVDGKSKTASFLSNPKNIVVVLFILASFVFLGIQTLFNTNSKLDTNTNSSIPQIGSKEPFEPDFLDDGFYSVELSTVKFVQETRTKTVNKTNRDQATGEMRTYAVDEAYVVDVPVTDTEQYQTQGFPTVKKFLKDGNVYFKVTLRPSKDKTIILDVVRAPTSITKIESGRSPVNVAPPAIEAMEDLFGNKETTENPFGNN